MRVNAEHAIYAERDGWTVIDSWEGVADRYEVRDAAGRRYGIWDSVAAALAHLDAKIAWADRQARAARVRAAARGV